MNISNHALLRYFQRMYAQSLLNEDSIKNMKRDNPEAITKASECILALSSSLDNIVLEADEKGKRVKFIINFIDYWIFVVDPINSTIMTMYPLKYNGISEQSTSTIVKTLIENELKPKLFLQQKQEEAFASEINSLETERDLIQKQIKDYNQKIQILETELSGIKTKTDLLKQKSENTAYDIELLIHKIVKPDYFLK